jgi:hypothetical protein
MTSTNLGRIGDALPQFVQDSGREWYGGVRATSTTPSLACEYGVDEMMMSKKENQIDQDIRALNTISAS